MEMQDKAKPAPLPLDPTHVLMLPNTSDSLLHFKKKNKYFLHFEKVAENLKWPKEHWALLLLSVVIGTAREIYARLFLEQNSDYDKVVRDRLFTNCGCHSNQSFPYSYYNRDVNIFLIQSVLP